MISYPMQHQINGIIVVDKPAGISSARVVANLKKLFKARKMGHTGTLDPLATGVMVCCMNDATRLARFFLSGNKRYEAVLRLGEETDTQDATGEVIAVHDTTGVSQHAIESTLGSFLGDVQQDPPVYSALKHKGVPLYRLARQGKPVQKPPREVTISRIDILDVDLPDVRLAVSCSAGTYIRVLCSDIGKALGCGAHLRQLRRVESCGFTLQGALTLEELEALSSSGELAKAVIDMAEALRGMPAYTADSSLAERIRHGVKIPKQGILPDPMTDREGFIKITDTDHELIAVLSNQSTDSDLQYCCVFNTCGYRASENGSGKL